MIRTRTITDACQEAFDKQFEDSVWSSGAMRMAMLEVFAIGWEASSEHPIIHADEPVHGASFAADMYWLARDSADVAYSNITVVEGVRDLLAKWY